MLSGVVTECSFGREKPRFLPGPVGIDEVDEIDSGFRECLSVAASR